MALVFFVILAVAPRAEAGVAFEHADIFYATPMSGTEYLALGSLQASLLGVSVASTDGFGFMFGGHGGFRIGPLSLGALYQRTQMFKPDLPGLNFNKLYGEVGINVQSGIVIVVLALAGGYAFYSAQLLEQQNGFGGRIGVAVDIYPTRWFSIGPGASADLMAYIRRPALMQGSVAASVGGSFELRIGFHL